MRKTATFLLLSYMTFLLFSCNQNAETQAEQAPAAATSPLTFELHNFKKQSPNCKSDTVSCATVQASYLMAIDGIDSVRQKINDTLLHYLKASLAVYAVEEKEYRIPLEQVASRFIAEYESLRKDNPAYDIPWEVETASKLLYQSSKLASIQFDTYSNTGGAHPNSFLTLLVLNKLTGDKVALSDFIIDRTKLRAVAEKHFRTARRLTPKQNLNDAGFFWGEAFTLPENFALLDGGLYCYYNNYDIAPYAVGPTEFTIPYSELEGILDKNKIF